MDPNVIHGLWVILMCLCRFINGNKCTTLVSDVDNARGWACEGTEEYRKSPYVSLSFAVKLKLL